MFTAFEDAWRRSPLRRRYEALAPRERKLVLAALAVVGLILAASAMDSLYGYRGSAIARHAAEEADLGWMRANRSAPALQGKTGGASASMSAMSTTARDFDLALRSINPEGEGYSVQIEGSPFEQVLLWSHALETRHGLEIVGATIDMRDPGIVNARFSVR